MQDRSNFIAMFVLGAGIVALGASIVTGEVFHEERPEKMGYPIAGVVEEGAGAKTEAEKPIEFYLASADAAKGADVFKQCAACHNADKGGANAIGPNLWGVVGDAIGKGRGYAFSEALSGKGGNWDWTTLGAWLHSPKTFAPGTKMTYAGLSDPQKRADVIAFLNSKSDAPKPMPAAPKEGAAAPTAAAADAAKASAEAKNGAGAQKAADKPVLTEQQAIKGGVKNIGGEGASKISGPKGVATMDKRAGAK